MLSPIRVLVVDDHQVVRRGLASLLTAYNDLKLVGEAQNGAEALELCAKTYPDIVLLDLAMPKMDGAEATRAIRERYPDVQVIVLTTFDECTLVRRALAAGAEGIALKNMSGNELVANIRRVYMGCPPLAAKSVEDIIRATQAPGLPPPEMELGEDLTEREHEVLTLLVQGLTNVQIGRELVISRATAKFHVSSILSKLGAATRTEAAARAVQLYLSTGPA